MSESLRDQLDREILFEATQSPAVRHAMGRGNVRELDTDEFLEMLFALHQGVREAIGKLADRVERLEARLGPEDDE